MKYRIICQMNRIFWGKVRKGRARGKSLGFPTANINAPKSMEEGVYVSKTKIGKSVFPSVTFVGKAKTFGDTVPFAESYILDFNKDIYGRWISIRLLRKLRGNKKFSSKQSLIQQMKRDVSLAKEFLQKETT